MALGPEASRDEAPAVDALLAESFGLNGAVHSAAAEGPYLSFMRLLPSALAARRDLGALADSLTVSLSGTFDALAGYYSRKGPFEGQVFCCSGMGDWPFPMAVDFVHSAGVTAFERLTQEPLLEFDCGLPFRLDREGRRATFLWFDETRAGALVLVRREEPFSRRTLLAAATCAAVAAEVISLGADVARLDMETRHDFLTGLLNRSFFEQALPGEVERATRSGGHFSLAFMDLDGFKRFNDSFGHRRGDDFLREVGAALGRTLRRADTAMRYGGDEFAIILPNTTPDQVAITLGRIRDEIGSIGRRLGADAIVGASFGVAHWPTDAATAEELVAAADSRLYHAKDQGRLRDNGPSGGSL